MWIKSENGEPTKPPAKEISGDSVILRRNFEHVDASEDVPEHWKYDEWQMTADQYDVYQYYEGVTADQSDALVELAELYAEQDDAIVELAELLEEV